MSTPSLLVAAALAVAVALLVAAVLVVLAAVATSGPNDEKGVNPVALIVIADLLSGPDVERRTARERRP